MAQAERPNPCAAFRSVPPPLPARRTDATPRTALPKDAPCPTSNGDGGLPGQCKKPPEHVMHKTSGGTYTNPDARVKLIPAEDITYVRHGKPFGRTGGSAKLQKRHCRRSVTPPSSRKVSLERSTPLTHKFTTPFTPKAMPSLTHKASVPLAHKVTAPLNHKTVAPLTHKPTTPPLPVASCLSPKRIETAHKATGPLSPKPTTPPLPVASCLYPKRVESAENRQFLSLNRPPPLYKAVHRGAFPPSVSRKESEMNPINPSSVHVPPAYSRKVPLDTKAEPSSNSVSTLDNTKLCSTSNQAALKCQPTKRVADPIVEKENTVKLPLLSPTSVLTPSSTEVCPDTGSRSSSRLNLFDGKCKLDSLQPETNIPQAKSPESTTPTPCAQLSNDLRAVSSTKSHVRNERQTNQEPSISCNMSSGAPLILHTQLCKKTYQPEACWKGKFEITGELTHSCDGLEAYFPREISSKVYEASKQMPEILKLEALPLSGLLPKRFKIEPPRAQDIGPCFISSCQRPNGNSYHLLENVSSHIGLRTDIDTGELLIFSSKLLAEDDQTKDGELCLCGVFQKHPRKRQHQADSHTDIRNVGLSKGDSHISEDIGMNLDMTGGKYTKGKNCEIGMKLDATEVKKMEMSKPKEAGKIFDMIADKQTERVKCKKSGIKLELRGEETIGISKRLPTFSNTAPAVSFYTGSCSIDTAHSPCKSATRTLACGDLVLDSPPGFPLNMVLPGFTRPHCRLRTETAESTYIDSSTSLALDTLGLAPDVPQFTATHRELNSNDTITCSESKNGEIVTQIFVNFGGSNLSFQENLRGLSVKDLMQSILKRVGVRISDFYCKCSGKYLDEENFISDYAIQKDSTIEVRHRLRAGTREQLIVFQTWNEIIAGKPRHHSVSLPPELISAKHSKQKINEAGFLSGFIQYYSAETLAALCEVYSRGFSLDGKFTSDDILFHKGKAFFADSVAEVTYTACACRNDFSVIHNTFHPVFWDEVNKRWPLHTEHLLNFLWHCPAGFNSRSEKVIVFLTNHPALLTYSARISVCPNLDSMIQRLFAAQYQDFSERIKQTNWKPCVSGVQAMKIVLEYRSRINEDNGFRILTYSDGGDQGVHFATNYFKHSSFGFSMEQLEAAFSLVTSEDNYLANLLQDIALDPAMPPELDLVELLGNNLLEGMERNPEPRN